MAAHVDPDQYTGPFLLTRTGHRDPYPAISPENPRNSQAGKIIIITGGGSGIGAAAAKVWARAGASGIVITGRRQNLLEKVSQEIAALNSKVQVLTVKADISVERNVENLYAEVQNAFGKHADVLLNSAGYLDDGKLVGEQTVDEWWTGFEINVKAFYSMIHHFIRAQPNPEDPSGTIITVSSGRAGLTIPGGSSYNIAKLAAQRLTEHVHLEYPRLRAFTTMPGIVPTDMTADSIWTPFAKDHADLTGMLALYLAQPRADYLKGTFIGVNWDVEEMELHKDLIFDKKLLQTSWLPVLPAAGGRGLSA